MFAALSKTHGTRPEYLVGNDDQTTRHLPASGEPTLQGRQDERRSETQLFHVRCSWFPRMTSLNTNSLKTFNFPFAVTEREVDAGVLQADDPESHVFCISRTITNINVRNKNARLFTDLIGDQPDEEAQELLSALKSRLTDVIPKCNVISYKLRWTGENGVSAANDEHQSESSDQIRRRLFLILKSYHQFIGSSICRICRAVLHGFL